MKRESFNSGWLFCRGSGTALERTISGAQTPVPVMLPHDAMIGTARDPQTPTGNATGYYLRDGKSAEQDRLLTASDEVHLEQADLGGGIIELSVMDKEGILNPEAVLTITAETKGERTILGFGSADPKSEENYFDKTIQTWHGRALIVTRGDGELKIEVQ